MFWVGLEGAIMLSMGTVVTLVGFSTDPDIKAKILYLLIEFEREEANVGTKCLRFLLL